VLVSRTAVRVHVCPEPTDMRKGYNGLFALARDALRADPMSGHLFLFVARNRKRAKVLYWDGTGLCILMKRLETGRFVAPWERLERPIQMTPSELQLFLEGAEALGRTLSPPELRFSA
jgi:transposase